MAYVRLLLVRRRSHLPRIVSRLNAVLIRAIGSLASDGNVLMIGKVLVHE